MLAQTILLLIGLLGAATFAITTIMIYGYLKERGEVASFIWLRIFMIAYADKYKLITKKETGHTGPLFYWWIISINIALVCLVLYLILL